MKNILLILILLLPFLTFGQSEEYFEKSQKRSEKFFRNNSPIIYNPYLVNPYNTPFYRPYIYSPWSYYPRTTRVNRNDDIKYLLLHVGFSNTFSNNTPYSYGVYVSFKGERMVTLFDIEFSNQNNYQHYDNISLGNVQYWNDDFIGELNTIFDFGIGVGPKVTSSLYPFVMASVIGSNQYLIFFDETYVLSNTGEYTINGDQSIQFNFGPGILFNYKFFELKTNFEILTPRRFNFGVGIKLF